MLFSPFTVVQFALVHTHVRQHPSCCLSFTPPMMGVVPPHEDTFRQTAATSPRHVDIISSPSVGGPESRRRNRIKASSNAPSSSSATNVQLNFWLGSVRKQSRSQGCSPKSHRAAFNHSHTRLFKNQYHMVPPGPMGRPSGINCIHDNVLQAYAASETGSRCFKILDACDATSISQC